MHGTTILALRHAGSTVVAGDGQVSVNQIIVKASAQKVRRTSDGKIIAGFAGSAADGMTLFDRFEGKLKEHGGNLMRAVVELAKDWRTDRVLRRLEALMVVANRERIFLLSGTGDVIEPDRNVIGIGSGGVYAQAAARALMEHTDLAARAVAERAMAIAAEICIYTNEKTTIEELS